MADNVFRNIGTTIARPIGEFIGGAVTALQPGRVQQMQFERQQKELQNHFNMFNRLLSMGDKASAYKYMTDAILPFVKASPELTQSVKQFQVPESTEWIDSAKQYSGLRKALPRDEWSNKILPEYKEVEKFLLDKEIEQHRKGGYGSEGTPTPTDVFEGLTPSVQRTPSPLATSPVQPPGQTIFGYPGMVGPTPVKTPAKLDDFFAGVPTEESPMDEIDVFEKLIPKKTVKQLQKQKSRDPTLMDLAPILSRYKVTHLEIARKAAELKPIWSELSFQEKLDVYELLARGVEAKKIIKHFENLTSENAQ